jgi:hypothetical protein
MSVTGSPVTATKSANFPGSMAPILSCQPSISAALVVTGIGNGTSGTPCRRDDNAGLHDLEEEMVVAGMLGLTEGTVKNHVSRRSRGE